MRRVLFCNIAYDGRTFGMHRGRSAGDYVESVINYIDSYTP